MDHLHDYDCDRPWPLMAETWFQVELLHALVLWEVATQGDELPTFAEVGGVTMWYAAQERLCPTHGARCAIAAQFIIARTYVAEAAHNYGRGVEWVREELQLACVHERFWGVTDGWLEGLD